ncbi:MAG TPA: amino acid adenylation domain-containing protein, partial [Thermoanaerobaculia bacterium]|nr:amino acid adenylation domain-containing protein [Thermoanaerobaculia bacterium]
LSLTETPDGLAGSWEYDPDLFDRSTVLRLARHFETLAAGVATQRAARVSALPLMAAAEVHQVLLAWNDSAAAYPRQRPLDALFAEQVRRRPDAVAVELGERTLSYRELDRRANQVARHLRRLGVPPGGMVGLCAERSLAMVVGLAGILKAGAAYVSLDPELPRERLDFLLGDTGIDVVLTLEALRDRLPDDRRIVVLNGGEGSPLEREDGRAPESGSFPESLAYVSYTSGSTGTPKGVAVPHRAVVRLVRDTDYLELAGEQVFLQLAPIAFDASTFEIWGPLLNGGRLVLMPPGTPSLEEIGTILQRHGVTTLFMTTGLFHQMVDHGLAWLGGVRQLLTGGDVMSVPHMRRALAALPRTRLLHAYGPTENTTFTTVGAPGAPEELGASVPIGRPIANTTVHVLDGELRPAAPGVWGELCTGGDGLAWGYLGRPDLTAGRFVPDPVGAVPGARLYRTGDVVRFLADGRIEFRGRVDRQVKLRGFRVELGEVEAALAAVRGVLEAVVVVREDMPGGRGLAAWVVAREGVELTAATLRAELRLRLPDYMIPGRFAALAALPLTPNGKVDRQALARQPLPGEAETAAPALPRTPFEELLAPIWAEVLGLERVGLHDDFFELGGHSLLATQVVSRVRGLLGVDLPLRELFEQPTVAGLARAVQAALETEGGRGEPGPGLAARPRGAHPPLSFAQERLWILDRFEPGNAAFNIATAVVMRGRLDLPVLARSLDEVVRRHEALRTTFGMVEGGPYQEIAGAVALPLPEIDLAALPGDRRARELRRLENAQAARPFDLEHGPLFVHWLVRLAAGEQALLINLHHIVADGWSLGVLVSELAALYEAFSTGRPSPLPELPVQYADYAAWQRDWLAGERLAAQLAYWRGRLAGELPVLELPLDRPRPPLQTFRGASRGAVLPRELGAGLRALARQEGATLFMVLLAAFEVLLARVSGQEDLLLGTPIAGRNRPETEGMIGCFLNTLVLRGDLSGSSSFRELLARTREACLGAYAHQDLPFERLLEDLAVPRDLSRTPLFQVFFNMLNLPRHEVRLPGLALSQEAAPEALSKFDLTLYLAERSAETGEGVELSLAYNADLFDDGRMEEVLRQYEGLLRQAVAAPERGIDRLSLLTPAALAVLPDPAAALSAAWRGAVHKSFARWAREQPGALAVRDDDETWTYGELDEQSSRLARFLAAGGVGRGGVVAIFGHRSAPLVWGILGVLKAGGAFLVLDPAYPAARQIEMLRLARPHAFLRVAAAGPLPAALEAFLAEPPGGCRLDLPPRAAGCPPLAAMPALAPRVAIGPDDIAYVAFTSGSTGAPKGILGRHGPLSHFIPWQRKRFALAPADRFSMLSGLAHDPLHRDLFTPLQTGAAVVIPDPERMALPGWLAGWMRREEITIAHLTPALGKVLTSALEEAEPVAVPSLRFVFLVGDVLTRRDAARLRRLAPAVTVINFYGSTETQRSVGYFVTRSEGEESAGLAKEVLPLGRGIPGVQLLVCNREGELAGIGEVGEIAVRSHHLAAGYLGDPELTGDRFQANPATGAAGDRWYRTGDLGRYLPDGNVVFVGRADAQVKIRGFRIELGEIEAVLGSHPAVQEAVVVLRRDGGEEPYLAAYVVPAREPETVPEALRAFLRGRLPNYMVPATFTVLAALPLTPNRKVDRRALPAPGGLTSGAAGFVAPEGPVEELVAGIWSAVLHAERIGAEDSFFDLGGHSLLATQVMSRLRAALGVELPLRRLFETPTVRGLARLVEQARREGAPPLPPISREPRTGDLPLSFAQERLWFLHRLDP